MVAHDDPTPGLSARGLLTIALAAAVVILLTLRLQRRVQDRWPAPWASTRWCSCWPRCLATTGIGPANQPSPAGKQARAAVDHPPALVKTVDRSWDRLTGAWEGLTELWQSRRNQDHPHPTGALSAPLAHRNP